MQEAAQMILQDDGTVSAEHGRCHDCRRKLKTPASRAAGRGPVCQRKHEAQNALAAQAARNAQAAENENSVNMRESEHA